MSDEGRKTYIVQDAWRQSARHTENEFYDVFEQPESGTEKMMLSGVAERMVCVYRGDYRLCA